METNATLIYREDITEELAVMRVAPDSGEVAPFLAGQYGELAMPEPEDQRVTRRPYSIASAPSQRGYLEFFLVLVPDGEVTPKLWSLPIGGRLWLGPKIKGKFTLEGVPDGKDLIFISTGTGIAPFVSMIREYHGKNRWRRAVMIHCVRYSRDLAYRTELENLAASAGDVIYLPTVTRNDPTWDGHRGRVQGLLEPTNFLKFAGFELDPAQCQVFLCGNPEMIDTTQAQLEGIGFIQHSKKNPGNLHFERFW